MHIVPFDDFQRRLDALNDYFEAAFPADSYAILKADERELPGGAGIDLSVAECGHLSNSM